MFPSLLRLCFLAAVIFPAFQMAHAKSAVRPSSAKEAIFVRLKAKPGKEAEVAKFLEGALPLVSDEPATALWFAVKFDDSTYAIFDAFADDAGRQTHLAGKVAAALGARAGELFAEPPNIEKATILAKKINKD